MPTTNLILVITIFPLFLQLLIGIFYLTFLRRYRVFKSIFVESKTSGAKFVENYVKIYRKMNVTVNADIPAIVTSENNNLVVNKDYIYEYDMFTLSKIAIAIALTHKKFSGMRNNSFQITVFLVQIVISMIAIYQSSVILAVVGAAAAASLIISGYYRNSGFSRVEKEVIDYSTDLLNLTEQESRQFRKAVSLQGKRFHLYSIDGLIGLVRFFRF